MTTTGCKDDAKTAAAPPEAAKAAEAVPAQTLDPRARAKQLAREMIIVDGHIDVPYRLTRSRAEDGSITEDISERTEKGDFDYPRAKAGGLDAPFMSIYIPAKYQEQGGAKKLADELIDLVESFERQWPDKFAVARSPADVEKAHADGKIALPLGIENGAALEDDLANVEHFYDRGVRYITLTHAKDNLICDSSYDERHSHGGLTAFGREVVGEMNRLGIMVDISHVSDDAARQVLELSEAPVIASHSSARHFTPGFERNMSDELIQKLADNGGVIMINFGSSFVKQASRDYFDGKKRAVKKLAAEQKLAEDDPELQALGDQYAAENPPVFATVTEVADHIDHVVKLVGIDHVGLGSDYDGVGDSLPEGLKDASTYPALIEVLLERGYTEQDIEKILSGNVLRVWRAVEAHAAKARRG